jgi:excisionase family DNA binding protein
MQKRFKTAVEVAPWLRTTTARIYELARQNKLPHIRVGRKVLFEEGALDAWANRGGTKGDAEQKSADKS